MSARKLTTLTLKEKYELVSEFECNKTSQAEFAKQKNLPRTTLVGILKKKEEIKKLFLGSSSRMSRKRQRKSLYKDVEDALVRWLKQTRSSNLPVSGPILKQKAMEIAGVLGVETNFSASDGWLERFKGRHGVTFKKLCGEKESVDMTSVGTWKETVLQEIEKSYKPENVFNLDETGLFYKLLPEKTAMFKNESCHGGCKSKLRVTILLGANSDGSEKLKPLVIGKFRQPRCFNGVKSLPVIYKANSKSWMTSKIWEEILHKYDSQFVKQKRNVAFVVDNCPAHGYVEGLQAINVFFLPPNATSVVQPLNQGIIHSFKRHYRKKLILNLIHAVESEKSTDISLLDAIHYVKFAWENVTCLTIANCFKRAGFRSTVAVQNEDKGEEQNVQLDELLRRCHDLRETASVDEIDYSTVDDCVEVCYSASVADIIAEIQDENNESGGEENETLEELFPKPTKNDALEALRILRCYLPTIDNCEDDVFKAFMIVENKVETVK
ncbi:tigger transposable element-derived protein 4-like [Centruroides sculpturatus]|uniref:tigger transposable element-derived protein 4-like n=1 Tax=Centruroides sculpturatus TaxID=218467 RepID=UPI000C6EB22E|nr:tigger transposable element-derived protein 4-like [Centruroides sculpturatus]